MADFHGQCEHKNNASRDNRCGQGDVAICDGHIGMYATHNRDRARSDDSQKQRNRKRDQSAEERH